MNIEQILIVFLTVLALAAAAMSFKLKGKLKGDREVLQKLIEDAVIVNSKHKAKTLALLNEKDDLRVECATYLNELFLTAHFIDARIRILEMRNEVLKDAQLTQEQIELVQLDSEAVSSRTKDACIVVLHTS